MDSRFAEINGLCVRISPSSNACASCRTPQWEVQSCPQCASLKVIRQCKNETMHQNGPGYFLLQTANQEYCSPECELPADDSYCINVLAPGGVSAEASICRSTSTPRQIVEYMLMHMQNADGNDWVLAPVGEKEWPPFEQDQILFPQLHPAIHQVPSEDDPQKKIYCVRVAKSNEFASSKNVSASRELESSKNEKSKEPTSSENLSASRELASSKNGEFKEPYAGKRPYNAEEDLLQNWFPSHNINTMTASRAKDRKMTMVKAEDGSGVAIRSLYGNTYYQPFLREYAEEHPEIISPFFGECAWIWFPVDAEWTQHYERVKLACPPRAFAPLKYLITTELMERDPQYSAFVRDDPQLMEYYEDMVEDYGRLKAIDFIPHSESNISFPKKKKKKKKSKKNQVTKRISTEEKESGSLIKKAKVLEKEKSKEAKVLRTDVPKEEKRLVLKVSRDLLPKKPFEEDDDDPYAVSDIESEDCY